MKITYKSVTGEVTEVEVSEEIGAVIIDSRRKEDNLDRKERNHSYSLDAITYEGEEYADEHTPDVDLLQKIDNAHFCEVFSKLTPTQQRRLAMYSEGMSYREIAEVEGAFFRSVEESIKAAIKKFKKHF